MAKKLFIGGLSWNTTDQTLRAFFETIGTVTSANVVMDKMTGRSRGFGFVEYENDEDADKAKKELDGKELDGRTIKVDEARPPERNNGGYNGGGDR